MKHSISTVVLLCALLALFVSVVSQSRAAEVNVFGPQKYIRVSGVTTFFLDGFPANPGQAKLLVENGEWDGDKRIDNAVSSARVFLNQQQIFGPNNFNQKVHLLEASVALAADNTLEVELNGSPNSFLTVRVVTETAPPTVELTVSPTIVNATEPALLSWSSAEADTASIDNNIGPVSPTGSLMVTPSTTTTYTITAVGPDGSAADSATLTVAGSSDLPSVMISASPVAIQAGQPANITWATTNADLVHLDNGIGNLPISGSMVVNPPHTVTYTITAIGPGGAANERLTITVLGDPEPQPQGSFGAQYADLTPIDSTVVQYDPKRFSLITGQVQDLDGAPLVGVSITIHSHPEYGTVISDMEGKFSIPVEGGGSMTVVFKKENFLTSHRQVYVLWNDIAVVESPQIVKEDPAATTLAFDGNPQTVVNHQSSQVVDAFGGRSVTMVFTGDNRAYVVDEQGNDVQELSSITTRATEFTTQQSMPAVLPPNSAYTYCAEFKVDGVDRVRFEKPVITYVDNFIGFLVGEPVPVGYYDRNRGVWVPTDNGIVVMLLDTDSNGIVDALDANGDGLPNDLNANGSFVDEVAGLEDPGQFASGATFWRVAITHFTPWDCNWPYGPPGDAISPTPEGMPDADAAEEECPDDCESVNSYVKKRGRVFHEDIPVPGTDLTLHYASDRVEGYQQVISVPASGATVPTSLKRIVVEARVAGRFFSKVLEPAANQMAEFVWDGLDHLGRQVRHAVNASVAIGFVYDAVYLTGGDFTRSFAQAGSEVTGIRARQEFISWQRYNDQIIRAGMGTIAKGWTISEHHTLVPGSPRLSKGNGSQLINNSSVITTVAGNGYYGFSGDNGPATEARIYYPQGIAMDQAGNLFIADQYNHRIRMVDSSGMITTVAGNGSIGFSGDNGPAIEASLNYPQRVAVDQAGNLFIADTGNHRIRKVDSSGIITTVAGNGYYGFSGDNGPATEARLYSPYGVAVDQVGNLFIADSYNQRIRKVDSSGIITTMVGNGYYGFTGDNGPAIEASLRTPIGVVVDLVGNLFIGDIGNHRIRKVDSSGIITTVAGNGVDGFGGDNGPGTEASLNRPTTGAVDQAGNLFIADVRNRRVRKVDTNGIISTVAGNGYYGFGGDNGPATEASLYSPHEVIIDQAGNLFITDSFSHRVRKISPVFNSHLDSGEIPIADPNGLGYIMSSTGLHKEIIDLASVNVLREFGYDQNDNLISITDQFGNIITIERFADGTPSAIISPDGLRTELYVDAGNHLAQITYPDGSAYNFTYSPDDLMTLEREPNGNLFEHRFDANGRLFEVLDEEGGNWQYYRQSFENGDIQIDSITAEGDRTSNVDHTSSTGAFTSTTIDPNDNQSFFSRSADGLSEEHFLSCGMTSTAKYGLDPEYMFKFVKSESWQSPSGLTRTTLLDKNYRDTNGDEVPVLITETISANGRTATVVNNTLQAQQTTTSPAGRMVAVQYDPATLVTTSLSVADLFPTIYGYDSKGRLTAITTNTKTTGFAYNAQGFLASQTDPEGRTTSYAYDQVGRVTDITRPDSTTVSLNYDQNGNMTVLTNPSETAHVFGYNRVNNQSSYQTPLSGSYSYFYDRDRRLTLTRFPSGYQVSNIYTNGLLTRTQTQEGNIDYSYLCSSQTGTISMGTESLSYGYDGSLLTSEVKTGILNQTIDFAYNNDFDLSVITYAGITEDLAYDGDSLLTGSGTYAITRNEVNGLPGQVSGGTFNLSRDLNGYGEVSGEKYTAGGRAVAGWNVIRDNHGRTEAKTETVNGRTDNYAYSYDSVGRLLAVTMNGTLVEEYRYGPNSNRTYEMNTRKGEPGRSYTYSSEDHLLTAGNVSYQFDVDGFPVNKTEGGSVTSYYYSSRGELLSVTLPGGGTIEYLHDPLGRRIAKKVNGITVEKYLWAGLIRLLAVYDGNDNVLHRFEYADGRMPVAMSKGGATYYLAYDQVGSLRAVSDASGNMVKQIDYDSFGNIITDFDPAFAVPFGFAGGLHDRDTGLVKFGHRDYDPAIGRWVAKDPIFFAGGDIDLYGYVLNNPINFVDPTGLYWFRQDWQKPGVIGRERTIVAPQGNLSEFIEKSVPAGYTFGEMHDSFVGAATSAGLPDLLVNIPSMIPVYGASVATEILRSVGILDQPVPPTQQTTVPLSQPSTCK